MLSEKEKAKFRELFSKYCQSEMNAGHCDESDCEFCAVDKAYDKVFSAAEPDDEECEDDDE